MIFAENLVFLKSFLFYKTKIFDIIELIVGILKEKNVARQFLEKLKESAISVSPIVVFVLLLNLTPVIALSGFEVVAFLVASVLVILGIALFSLGADIAMTPMGKSVGSGLTKQRKLGLLLFVVFVIGLLITIAEPDLTVLAKQVSEVMNGTVLIVVVGLGVALFLMLSIIKMVFKTKLSMLLMFSYLFLFAITSLVIINGNGAFLPLSFDSGGVTTGPITVPFIMALGIGVASSLGSKDSRDNSFGLVALCSVGAVMGVMILGISIDGNISYTLADYSLPKNLVMAFLNGFLHSAKEVALALGLIVVFFLICQFTFLKLSKQKLAKLGIGMLYTFVGLVIFLSAVNTVYISIGFKIGSSIATINKFLLIPIGLVIGAIVVLAEPAIHILNKQVEQTTNKTITKRAMLIGLTIGVGLSIALSMVRIIFDFSVLYYLVPGYIISLGLSFFVPSIYTAVAFDSGGVASGPLTSSFILPLGIGACAAISGEVAIMSNAFGVVAMVAMTPLITIQILGFSAIVKQKIYRNIAMNQILSKDDKQIIDFM